MRPRRRHNRAPAKGRGTYEKRVIEHRERVEVRRSRVRHDARARGSRSDPLLSLRPRQPADYKSTAQETHGHPDKATSFVTSTATGRRAKAAQAAINATITTEFEAESAELEARNKMGSFTTNSSDSFVRHPESLYVEAHMKSKSKKVAGTASAPDVADDRTVGSKSRVSAQSYDEGDAVTIYSESLATGENRFPMSSVTGAHAPFGRSAGFTNSIHDREEACGGVRPRSTRCRSNTSR